MLGHPQENWEALRHARTKQTVAGGSTENDSTVRNQSGEAISTEGRHWPLRARVKDQIPNTPSLSSTDKALGDEGEPKSKKQVVLKVAGEGCVFIPLERFRYHHSESFNSPRHRSQRV